MLDSGYSQVIIINLRSRKKDLYLILPFFSSPNPPHKGKDRKPYGAKRERVIGL